MLHHAKSIISNQAIFLLKGWYIWQIDGANWWHTNTMLMTLQTLGTRFENMVFGNLHLKWQFIHVFYQSFKSACLQSGHEIWPTIRLSQKGNRHEPQNFDQDYLLLWSNGPLKLGNLEPDGWPCWLFKTEGGVSVLFYRDRS